MYRLSVTKQEQVIALLECCSIRAIERITGVHRDTVMRLGLRAGRHAYLAMDRELRDIQAERIECDELWTYVAKKGKWPRSACTSAGTTSGASMARCLCTPAMAAGIAQRPWKVADLLPAN
jgi:hypothetical protein